MGDVATGSRGDAARGVPIFVAATFLSACLVFLVEPMVAKMVLPLLGGSPAVWNTSLAFFQFALLFGYAYAHLLQRVRSLKTQALVHIAALALAVLALPLRVTTLLGPASNDHPALWLLGVLAISIGAPFAVLSATAPLVQAWFARVYRGEGAPQPYPLYAASNLGSLLALLAYPTLVEPFSTLAHQRMGWSALYICFAILLSVVALRAARQGGEVVVEQPTEVTPRPSWKTRLGWLLLSAAPSSLMLGVTNHLAMDVASTPFLWVGPLALYLLTFVIAFADKPPIRLNQALLAQAVIVPICAAFAPYVTGPIAFQIILHLATFFVTALVCHLVLVGKRPAPDHLTEFYFWMSLGGVVGGGFNAFVAPLLFSNVWEYPIILVLALLARPWEGWRIDRWRLGVVATCIVLTVLAPITAQLWGYDSDELEIVRKGLLLGAAIYAVPVRNLTPYFVGLVALISFCAEHVGDRINSGPSFRNFFGVISESIETDDDLGDIKIISHGSTLHGAQAQDPELRCKPLLYYNDATPIGAVFAKVTSAPTPVRMGVVGLGAGVVSTITRPGDVLDYFEINPVVVKLAKDPEEFTFLSNCSKGKVNVILGDARFTVEEQPNQLYDFLMIDAFSSDAIPAHLMTVEAMKIYLAKLKPGGVLMVHISNRNLELASPAMAVAKAAGGYARLNDFDTDEEGYTSAALTVMIVGKSAQVVDKYAVGEGWTAAPPEVVRPWTDDYTNLMGALIRRAKQEWANATAPDDDEDEAEDDSAATDDEGEGEDDTETAAPTPPVAAAPAKPATKP